MTILKLNIRELSKEISLYEETHCYDQPVLLISKKTERYLIESNPMSQLHTLAKQNTYNTLLGCKIAIADWVPFGEVELR